jgi:hypothetical protein
MKRLLFISLLLLALTSCKKEDIYDESGYAIGTVTKSLSVFSVITCYYEYKVGIINH